MDWGSAFGAAFIIGAIVIWDVGLVGQALHKAGKNHDTKKLIVEPNDLGCFVLFAAAGMMTVGAIGWLALHLAFVT